MRHVGVQEPHEGVLPAACREREVARGEVEMRHVGVPEPDEGVLPIQLCEVHDCVKSMTESEGRANL